MLDSFGVWMMYGLGQACVTYGGILLCIFQQKKKLKYLGNFNTLNLRIRLFNYDLKFNIHINSV